ncbi:MAG: type II toxin-antitoxin system RelE/ParE family toxin [Saprospiraceae bacterium]|nr:type II toxin-antitoxin system RelE/ParE family toxin [Saprospiraceae bacterium]MBK9726542.1 type II toxin-antitoxin system RelE/ParE family toxin [Saprospiraceae bacterium]
MTKPIAWSQNAKNDLKNIKKFFDTRNQSSTYSKKLLKTFRDSAKLIEKFPLLSIPTENDNVRGFVILEYIIFYEIMSEHILVLIVWDCRRDPEQLNKLVKR